MVIFFKSKQRQLVFLTIVSITIITSVFFTNCYNIKLLAPHNNSSETPPPPDPTPEPLNLPEQQQPANLPQSPEVAPTVTESQCDAYYASNPTFEEGQQPAIYFLCDKILFSARSGAATRALNLSVSPGLHIDFSHHGKFVTLFKRISAGDTSVTGITVNWWTDVGAPTLTTNPADPLSRMIQAPELNGSKFTVYFQILKGTEAGLVHKINFLVNEVNQIQTMQNVSCPGFASTINILPYTDLINDAYFTASHGFFDQTTAVVMPFKLPAGVKFSRVYFYNPYSEDWVHSASISTRPCDFSTNLGTVFNSGGSEFSFYTTDLPRGASNEPLPPVNAGLQYQNKLDAGRVYYLNMRVPVCPKTTEGLQRNCYSKINFSIGNFGVPLNYVDEFLGVLVLNGAEVAPRYPHYRSGIQQTR